MSPDPANGVSKALLATIVRFAIGFEMLAGHCCTSCSYEMGHYDIEWDIKFISN